MSISAHVNEYESPPSRASAHLHNLCIIPERVEILIDELIPTNKIPTMCTSWEQGKAIQREFPAVPVPPSQIDRIIVPGQRRELHLYDPSNVAAVRSARSSIQHLPLDTLLEYLLCCYTGS